MSLRMIAKPEHLISQNAVSFLRKRSCSRASKREKAIGGNRVPDSPKNSEFHVRRTYSPFNHLKIGCEKQETDHSQVEVLLIMNAKLNHVIENDTKTGTFLGMLSYFSENDVALAFLSVRKQLVKIGFEILRKTMNFTRDGRILLSTT